MDRDAVQKTLDVVKAEAGADCPVDMGQYIAFRPTNPKGYCNTPACAAGWACYAILGYEGISGKSDRDFYSKGSHVLGLDATQAENLFMMGQGLWQQTLGPFDRLPEPTRKQALINVLQGMLDTDGEVDWPKAIRATGAQWD